MGMSGGGGGTTTQVVNNTPFNADQLRTVQNAAIDLLNTNPLSYYPGTTYAPPNDQQLGILNNTTNLYGNAGNMAAGNLGNQQSEALSRNQGFVNGDALNGALPNVNNLFRLGGQNPAQQGMNALSPLATGGSPYEQMLGSPWSLPGGSQLNGYASGGFFNTINPITQNLMSAANVNSPGAGALWSASTGQAQAAANPYISALGNAAAGPGGAGLSYASNGGGYGALSPYTSGLSGVAGGTAANDLAQTANGSFLGANPFLNSMFESAANPVVDKFMTATAPQTDSLFARYNRFGSGSNMDARAVNQRALGQTLSDLSAGIYGPAYQQERSNMVNAAGQLGNLQTNALSNAGSLTNAATNSLINASGALGNLNLGGLGAALGGVQTGTNQMINAGTNLGNLNLGGLTNAGNVYNQQAGITTGAANNLMNGSITGLSDVLNQMRQSALGLGTLGVSGQNSQTNALDSGLNNYYRGIAAQQNAINATPTLSNMGLSDYNAALQASNSIQQLQQQAINDQMARFYGNETAPWTTLGYGAGIVGSGIPGSVATTTPIGSSGLGQVLGGLGAANSLFGGNGMLSGLNPFSGGGIGAAATPLADAALAAGGGNAGLASALGLGGADAIPFTQIAGAEATGGILPEILPFLAAPFGF